MDNKNKAYLFTHIAVILWGFTAILGKLISLSAIVLVGWRVFLTSLSLFLIFNIVKRLKKLTKKQVYTFSFIGIIIAMHWICFYGSLKYANASIALICMATTSFFTSILEPFMTKTRFKWPELGIGLIIVWAMSWVGGSLAGAQVAGFLVGILSAIFAAIFTILNKKHVAEVDAISMTFVQLTSSFLFIAALLPFVYWGTSIDELMPTAHDWPWLLCLAIVCTTLPYVIALWALKHISAFASNLIVNLEPVYGILLAALILHEHQELTTRFYVGALIIIGLILLYPFLKKKLQAKNIES